MYSSDFESLYAVEEFLESGAIASLFSGFPSTLLSIATYVLTALGLYTIAKRRGINKPWLAWIPVVNVWILGSISDQYRYVVKGENKSKRKALLILNIILGILSFVTVGLLMVMLFSFFGNAMAGASEAEIFGKLAGLLGTVVVLFLPLLGVSIAHAVIYFMALYDVYTSCDPGNNVLFLVLSILFGVTKPFFLFFSRNKDNGMPPRRPEPVNYTYQEPVWQPTQPAQEPWEQENKDYL